MRGGAPLRLSSTSNSTVRLPVLLAPLVTLIHETSLRAVHVQPSAVVTETVPFPPPREKFWLERESENVHPFSCVTVTTLAAIVAVPVRAGPVLAAIASCTAPLPVPLAAPEIEIQEALLVDVHEQSALVVT